MFFIGQYDTAESRKNFSLCFFFCNICFKPFHIVVSKRLTIGYKTIIIGTLFGVVISWLKTRKKKKKKRAQCQRRIFILCFTPFIITYSCCMCIDEKLLLLLSLFVRLNIIFVAEIYSLFALCQLLLFWIRFLSINTVVYKLYIKNK